MKKLFLSSILIFFTFLFSLKCQDRYNSEELKPSERYTASVQTDKKITDKDWLTEKKAILFFWTIQCPYCRTEIKSLNNLCDYLESKGVKTYFVNVQDAPSKVQRYIERLNIRCPVVLDTRAALAIRYRIPGVPTYIFLENGVETYRSNTISRRYIESIYAG